MAAPLNPRQLKFVEEYLRTGIATQAYIAAGYKGRGKTAEVNASRLLGDARVKAAIEEHQKRAAVQHGITAEWFARRVKTEAEREGEDASHAARVSALKLAGQMLGVLSEKYQHEHSGPGGGPIPTKSEHEHRFTLTPADLDAADRLAPVAGGGVHPDGGPEPVHPAPAVAEAASVSSAL